MYIIAVGWPFRASTLCTRKNANKAILAVVASLCLVYIVILFESKQQYQIIYDKYEARFIVFAGCTEAKSYMYVRWIVTGHLNVNIKKLSKKHCQ